MLTGCEKLWKLLIEKNMKNSLFMNKSTKPMMGSVLHTSIMNLKLFCLPIAYHAKNIRATNGSVPKFV